MSTPMTLTPDQQIALGLLKNFVIDEIDRVFVLKGYAGTGKTTLIEELVLHLKNRKNPFTLLASTGRAAKVLSKKSGFSAATLHSHIYTLHESHYQEQTRMSRVKFKLKPNNDNPNTIYIVDEASMISDHLASQTSVTFGSGRLLTDFFTYTQKGKVIFVGDPAQLPPINSILSPALSTEYITEKHHLPCKETFLYEVVRYKPTSGIYHNAKSIRGEIESKQFAKYLKIKVNGFTDLSVAELDSLLIEQYVNVFNQKGMHSLIMLAYTNNMVNMLNQQIRRLLFPGKERMQVNELVIVSQNNYLQNLSNGEQLLITHVDSETRNVAGINFRDIRYKLLDSAGAEPVEHACLIVEEFLYRPKPLLTDEEEANLLHDFFSRCYKEGLKGKTDEINRRMLNDPYLNALRIRFGYAVTCHKAQGGEWSHVFLILENMLFVQTLTDPMFMRRWIYTALTRAEIGVTFLSNICMV